MTDNNVNTMAAQLRLLADSLPGASANDAGNAVLETFGSLIGFLESASDGEIQTDDLRMRGALCLEAAQALGGMLTHIAGRLQADFADDLTADSLSDGTRRLRALMEEIEQAQSRSEAQRHTLEQRQRELALARERCGQLTGEASELEEALREANAETASLTARKTQLNEEMEELGETFKKLDASVAEMNGQVEEQRRSLLEKEAENKRLEETVASFPAAERALAEELIANREKMRMLRNRKKECAKEIRDKAKKDLAALEEDVTEKEEELRRIRRDITLLTEKSAKLNGDLHEIAETELTEIHTMLTGLSARLPAAEAEIDQAQKTCLWILRRLAAYRKTRNTYAGWWDHDRELLTAFEQMLGKEWQYADVFEKKEQLDSQLEPLLEEYDRLLGGCLSVANAQYREIIERLNMDHH